MKYEFHVGDYVETKGGATGYISNDKELWWRCTNKSDGYVVGLDYTIVGIETGFFNRIGQYDFTKQKNGKQIEHFEYNHLCSGELITAKINELVDAVNKLTKEYEDHLEGHRQTER